MYFEEYHKKLVTAEEAVATVKSGDWVDYASASPSGLPRTSMAARGELSTSSQGGISMWMAGHLLHSDPGKHFTWNSCTAPAVDRKIIDMAAATTLPCAIRNCRHCTENVKSVDVAMFQVAP